MVVGVICIALAIPSLISAYSESRAPRLASVLAVAGGAFVVYAVTQHPMGYEIADLPDVFTRVFARLIQ
ncbi:hypothetical protein EKE94_17075 [Mesobaculum littorinae]|uniref:Uncharacterized protein n=1 Tax=Mesobaculum littorinae TaxID=2486419 RepID=A0A438ADW5_9RHOB|nr:hypothetical protein EKE94_17075 [Mesobaculum littorinae]